MLLRFAVSNYLSFGEELEFNMIAGSFKGHREHVYPTGEINLLRAAAIYGANGAGKSNLVKAMSFFKNIIQKGKISDWNPKAKFRLDLKMSNEASTFEIEWAFEKTIYNYGVSINQFRVEEEWLYKVGITKKDKLIFERKTTAEKIEIEVAQKYGKSQKQRISIELMEENPMFLANDELFLNKASALQIEPATLIQRAISEDLVLIFPTTRFRGLVNWLSASEENEDFANQLLGSLGTGVAGLKIEKTPLEAHAELDPHINLTPEILGRLESQREVFLSNGNGEIKISKEDNTYYATLVTASHHPQESNVFFLGEESDGTRRMIDFLPAVQGILKHKKTVIIDEIDQSLHATLLLKLVSKIMGDKNTKGQLIFTTHESLLLDLNIFRQDEIWFMEKNPETGASTMYSLSEFKPRYDLDIQKGYLKGRFGAIPFLGKLDLFDWSSYAEEERV